ncbi:MAG TPA: AMP-binding protein [Rhabdaerophilum sp.]|nr:AMP-binding protein [Rhabdaerophilum sp.]
MTTDTTRLLNAPWDKITVSSLVEAAATRAPRRVFLRDCPQRLAWNGVEPRELTFETFQRAALFLASQLRTLGVQPGDTVLLMLPSSVEGPLAFAGTLMAGAIPAIVPADEKIDTLRAMAERSEATAIITVNRIGDIKLGEKARQVAARLISIRCVAGFGFDLPDGIVSLEGWSEEDVMPLSPQAVRQDRPALVTFGRKDGSICAFRRTEAQLIAEMLLATTLAAPSEESGIVSLMQPGSSASIAAGFLLALQAKTPLALVGPYDTSALAEALQRQPGAILLAPDHFIARLQKDGPTSGIAGRISMCLAISHIPGPEAVIPASGSASGPVLIDFEEHGLIGLKSWPRDGKLEIDDRPTHPLAGLIPDDQPYLGFDEGIVTGFGAAEILRRPASSSAGKAA